MARIFPAPIYADTASNAERKLYNLLRDGLDDKYVVIHSVRWITTKPRQHNPVGEADFVIAHPRFGVLILEVKGGGISLEAGKWYTVNAEGERNPLNKDPFQQADKSVYALRDHLQENRSTSQYRYPIYSAVAFPDISVDPNRNLRPDIPRVLIIDKTRLSELQKSIEQIFEYWHARYYPVAPGDQAIAALTGLLVPRYEITTKISSKFEEEDQQIKALTEAQFATLRYMQMFRRLAVIGGAGTGKTMLAVEKARQLAASGLKVLLLCYNTNLATWLSEITADVSKISVFTFHKLTRTAAYQWAELASSSARDDDANPEDTLYDALAAIRNSPEKVEAFLFDAVIIDEAQDFERDYWIPIPELLKDTITGVLYVFFDDNQRIYTQLTNIPISKEQPPVVLSDNCRNTKTIFESLKTYTGTTIDTRCIGPEGRPIQFIPVTDDAATKKALQSVLHDLIVEKGVTSEQIVVLTPRREDNSLWKEGLKLGNYHLAWRADAVEKNQIRVSTIHRFKGLESPVVILTEMNHAFQETAEQLTYIGISRARNHLVVIGDLPVAANRSKP